MSKRIIPLYEVMERLSLSRSGWYRLANKPPIVRVTERKIGVRESDLNVYISGLKATPSQRLGEAGEHVGATGSEAPLGGLSLETRSPPGEVPGRAARQISERDAARYNLTARNPQILDELCRPLPVGNRWRAHGCSAARDVRRVAPGCRPLARGGAINAGLHHVAAELAKALHAKRLGASWTARCPAHDDRNPSLSICETADGLLLLKCFAGCEFADVRAACQRLSIWPAGDGPDPLRRRLTKSEMAQEIWRQSEPIGGGPALDYFSTRIVGLGP